MSGRGKTILMILGALIVLFLLAQLVPLSRTNPPVVTQVNWDSPQTKALFDRSCADCHSNQTNWRWYTYVAPASWLVVHDVNDGRDHLNLDELSQMNADRLQRRTEEIGRVIQDGKMPPLQYTIIHPIAILNAQEKQQLADGLQKTIANTLK